MTRYEVRPLEGIGPVRLGMTRSEVRAAWPEAPRISRRGGDAGVDGWHANSYQVFYDAAERVEFVRGKAAALVRHLDAKHAYDRDRGGSGHSFTFPDVELALWRQAVPGPDEQDEGDNGVHFDTVGIGRPGYFSEDG